MIDENLHTLNHLEDKEPVRCAECDREMSHYITFTDSINENRNICWQCLQREEKGFNAKRDFKRGSRYGVIPR